MKETTLDDLKDLIGFPKDDIMYRNFSGLMECWYNIALSQGKTEKEAIGITLDKYGESLTNLAFGILNKNNETNDTRRES